MIAPQVVVNPREYAVHLYRRMPRSRLIQHRLMMATLRRDDLPIPVSVAGDYASRVAL